MVDQTSGKEEAVLLLNLQQKLTKQNSKREKGSKTTMLEKTDATYATWDAENSMIMACLVNAMEEDISANYTCYSTSKNFGAI